MSRADNLASLLNSSGLIDSDDISAGAVTDNKYGGTLSVDNGKLGIGTASPNATLTAVTDANSTAIFSAGVEQSGGSFRYLSLLSPSDRDDGNSAFRFDTANAYAFRVDGTDRLTIASGGNVGIGTASPGTTLDVNGTITDDVSDVRTPRRIAISTTGQTISNEGVYYLTPPASSIIYLGAPAAGTVMTLYNNTGNTISLEDGNTVTHLRLAADNNTTHNPALTLGAYSTTTITMFSGIHALVTGTDVT